jgi:23S rRNA pseudouridine2605 synthase
MRRRAARGRSGGGRLARGSRTHAGRREQRAGPDPAGVPDAERLQKVLARAGLASRREVETWIRSGRLTVNGVVATLGTRVTRLDQVRLDGRRVHARTTAAAARVFVCHRSPGEPLTPAEGTVGPAATLPRPGWLERLPRRAGRRFIAISPMPRVDGGLELVSSDGELAARLQRAVHALSSEFSVRVRGQLSELQLEGIQGGVLDSGARLAVERCAGAGGEAANHWYTLTARGASGKEVRQLFERQGALVSRVLRTHLGPVALERALGRGRFRELTAQELQALIAPTEPPNDPRSLSSVGH